MMYQLNRGRRNHQTLTASKITRIPVVDWELRHNGKVSNFSRDRQDFLITSSKLVELFYHIRNTGPQILRNCETFRMSGFDVIV